MSDLPDGLSESFFYQHASGREVELLNFRRYPDIDFVRKRDKKRKSLPGSFRAKRGDLIVRDGMLCHYCKEEMIAVSAANPGRLPHNAITIEHIVPRSMGGSNMMCNLVLACNDCNNSLGSQYYKCLCNFCENARFRFKEKQDEAE